MKKFVLLLGIVFAFQAAFAQLTDDDIVVFNLELVATLEVTVDVGGTPQTITFDNPAQYNLGVWEGNGISPGNSGVYVEGTVNWNMTIEAPDFTDGTNDVPIENLGVWIQATGTNQFGPVLTCPCQDIANTMSLTNLPVMIIDLVPGQTNIGSQTQNYFVFNWRMGTIETAAVVPGSMFDQIAAGDFPLGFYSTTAVITVTEIL